MNNSGNLDLVGGIGVFAPTALRRFALKRFGGGDDTREVLDFVGVLIEGMPGDEESEYFFFIRETLAFFPLGDLRQIMTVLPRCGAFVEEAEETCLALGCV